MKRVYKITFITMVISGPALFGQWQKYIIDNTLSTPEVVAIGDLNGDTKPDVVVNDLNQNKIILYENNYPDWNKHILDPNLAGAYVPDIGDLDGDGDLDVAASGYRGNVIVWYENNFPVWNKHTIAKNLKVSGAVSIADIDGDDTLDIVSSGYRDGGDLVWYKNNHPIWTKHTIRSDYATEWSWVGDVDGDGAIDVAVARWYENEVNWFRNDSAGLSWSEFIIDDSLDHASHLYISDIDGDNDTDIAAAGASGNVIVWYENKHMTWFKHTIDHNLGQAWCVVVVDIDGDEKPDVAATGRNPGKVVWYKNNHPLWEKQIIDANLNGANILLSADIDKDNALDIVVPGVSAGNVVWYKNPHTNVAFAESVEAFPKYLGHTDDTLKITVEISNPENHLASAYTIVNGIQSTYQDSIELFDDGLHGDGEPSDNICANNILMPTLEEDFFEMKLVTTDSNESKTTYSALKAYFTTAGPIVIDTFTIVQPNDSLVAITDLYLKNLGDTREIPIIKAKLLSIDSSVSRITRSNISFGNISAGQSKKSVTALAFINKNMTDTNRFIIEIKSSEIHYWTDTLLVIPQHPSGITHNSKIPLEYALHQNYPNPFNPSTTIKYSIPSSSVILSEAKNLRDFSSHAPQNDNVNITLKVYDILGREVTTLVNEKQRPGNYEVEFDASTSSATGKELTSGIYFYQLQTGKYLETKKMLMIK